MTLNTIKSKRDFKKVYRHGHSIANRSLVLYILPNRAAGRRFGFSVSKKLGKAVVRNRLRRQLKEICRLNSSWFPPDHDLVIVLRPDAVKHDYHFLSEGLFRLAQRAGQKKGGG